MRRGVETIDAEEEDKNASSRPAPVTHGAIVRDEQSTSSLVKTQTHRKLTFSSQLQQD